MITTLLTLTVLAQPTGGACAIQSTSRAETLMNPTTGSDERFFSRPNGAPNILFLVDTSAGALGWSTPLPTASGCGDPDFGAGYDPNIAYEPVVQKVSANNWPTNDNDYNKDWFADDKIYELPANGDFGVNLKNAPLNLASLTSLLFCATDAACKTCLDTKGYYKSPGILADGGTSLGIAGKVYARGRFLNYAGPKYVAVSAVLSQLVRDVQNVRFGVISSYKWDSKEWDQANGMDPGVLMSMMEPFWPSCQKMFDSNKKFQTADTEPQRNSVLNNISNDSNADFAGPNLLSAMLYGGGYYYSSRNPGGSQAFTGSGWPDPVDNDNKWKEGGSNQKSVCDACVYSAIIYINASTVDPTKDLPLSLPNYAKTIGGNPAPNCNLVLPDGGPSACTSKADELAAWLARNDFRKDYGGKQSIATYVVDINNNTNAPDNDELLRNVARMGGGLYIPATNAGNLKQAIIDAIADISNRGQTFATSAVTSIQTGQINLTQLVPRMYPQRNLPWNGELYRFAQRNEFVLEVDLNGDGDQNDVFVVDKDNDVVVEASDGYFKKAGSYSNLTQDLSDGGITADANPFWEASARIKAAGHANRKIFTVVDRADSRASLTHQDQLTEFKTANWSDLAPMMGLQKSMCPNGTNLGAIFTKLGLSVAQAASDLGLAAPATDLDRYELCAKVVIEWVRGRDIADEDGDGNRTETRDSVLADIFHSSPVVVEPPAERFLCDLGISNQCGRTLYADSLPVVAATPLDSTANNDPSSLCKQSDGVTPISWTNPYDYYRARQRARDRVVVVGSNGGMLHVFNNGVVDAGTVACNGVAWDAKWDEGTGDEEWAFIPPDLLPKLQDMMANGHEYFMDGDIMVRDVWVDGSGSTVANADGKKQHDEFHTMVIAAEGRGGQHYVALELRFPNDTNGGNGKILQPSVANPFRWIFPQPGSFTSSKFGKTLFTLSPKPPPIGPVLIEYGGTGKVNRYGVDTREAWVVMVGGGWSPGYNRGRGVYMIDAYWGVINGREDNLYWKAELDVSASGDKNGPLTRMGGSFAAPVAMADYGSHDAVMADGFFDTAVVGDTLGQVWVARFFRPGHLSDEPSGLVAGNESVGGLSTKAPYLTRTNPGEVDNWSIGRAFEMDRDTSWTGPSNFYKSIRNKSPFFYLPSLAIEPSTLALRAFLGTGNRYALLEPYSGYCRWDNLYGCAKYGCDDVRVETDIERFPHEINSQINDWEDRIMDQSSTGRWDYGFETRNYCDTAEVRQETFRINDCDQQSGGNKNYGEVNHVEYFCGDQGWAGSYGCWRNDSWSGRKTGDLNFNIDTGIANANEKERYFGLYVYGTQRNFEEKGSSTDGGTTFAQQFDNARLNDRTDLADVTNTDCPFNGPCTGTVAASSSTYPNAGWFYEYSNHGMKTATGSAIVSSCVLWSSLNPGASVVGGTEACATSVATSSFFQGDFVTGEPNCAVGFANPDGGSNFRFLQRDVLTPPPEPATIVQISQSGQIRYSAQLPEPGKGTQFQVDVTAGGDVLQSVYEVPVSRQQHNCRHTSGGSSNCIPTP